jgi:hypothetical protein
MLFDRDPGVKSLSGGTSQASLRQDPPRADDIYANPFARQFKGKTLP